MRDFLGWAVAFAVAVLAYFVITSPPPDRSEQPEPAYIEHFVK